MGSYAQSENITGRLDDAGAFGFNVDSDTSSLPVDVYNGILGHRLLFKGGLSIGWTFNANHSIAIGNTNSYIGPGANLSKSLFKKKLSLNSSITYNRQYANSIHTNHVLNFRAGLRYSPQIWDKKYGKLSMAFNGNLTNRLPVGATAHTQNLTITANLAYQF